MADDAIDKAVTDAEVTDVADDKVVEETTEEAPVKKTRAVKEADDDADSDVDLPAAKNLFRMLQNPQTSAATIRALAAQAGITLDADATKSEKKAAARSITEIVKESLGEKFDFLAEGIGPALEQAFKAYSEEQDKKFNALFTEQQQRTVENAVDRLYETHEDASEYENRIVELMDEFPRPKGADRKSLDKYMTNLYRIAKSEATEKTAKQKMSKKLAASEQDVTSRLGASGRSGSDNSKPVSKVMSLDDAANLAIEQLKLT